MAVPSRSERYRQIVSVMMDEGLGTLVDQFGFKHGWLAHARGAQPIGPDAKLTPEARVRRTFERLGPTFAKIGQLLSVRPDLIPASYAKELAKLQDEMAPFPFEQVKVTIEDAFGGSLRDLYLEFDETPAAAASIGQVHFARLPDGTPVAVKIQRPGVHEIIESDLDILRTQARRVQGRTDLGRRYDLVGLVDEFARVIREECDYVKEGENAERLREAFGDDESVYFPRIYWDRTSDTVLTMERIEGVPFNDLARLDAEGVDRHLVAREGIVCYYEQIFIHGFYHADPHPGNLFALPDGSVAFTDFGRCGELSLRARTLVADLLIAIMDQDGPAVADVLIEVSKGGSEDTDIGGLQADAVKLIGKYYDLELQEVDSRVMVYEVMSLVGRHGLTMDSEFALLLTTFATLQALATNVDPSFHFVESVRPFAERLVEKEMEPGTLMRNFATTARGAIRSLQVMPEQITRVLKRVGDGSLSMTVRLGNYDPLMARVEQIADRLAFALVVSSFVVGLSFLLTRSDLPWWLELVAGFTLVCSAGVGVWFFFSIIFRRFRQRGQL